MTIDFHEEYKHYSNAQLLWIVRQPDEYQPEAVAAATKILEQREVTDEDSRWVDSALQDLAFARQYESQKFGRMKAKTAELFPPVFQAHKKIEPSKWLNFLLLVIGIEYVWMLYGAAKELAHIFSQWTLGVAIALPLLYMGVLYLL